MTFFPEKNSIFTAKISDDLFLVIDQISRSFPFFSKIVRIFTMLNVVYDLFLTRKTPFLLCSYFRAHPTTTLYFSKYWGDGCKKNESYWGILLQTNYKSNVVINKSAQSTELIRVKLSDCVFSILC